MKATKWVPSQKKSYLSGARGEKAVEEFLYKHDIELVEHVLRRANDLNSKILRKLRGITGLPDFKIKGKNLWVEVKTFGNEKYTETQLIAFPLLVQENHEVLIAKPDFKVIKEKSILNKIFWYEYKIGEMKKISEKTALEKLNKK